MALILQEHRMQKTVAEMIGEELRELVGAAVEQKIVELLGDPDAGLVLRENVRQRLLRQRQAVAKGERGQSLKTVRSEEHTSELQSRLHLVCRLLLEKKKKKIT